MDIQNLVSLIALGQLTLLITVFVLRGDINRLNVTLIVLLLSIAGYLVVSNSVFGTARPFFLFLALATPYLLWLFAIELFEVPYLQRAHRYLILLLPIAIFAGENLDNSNTWQLVHQVGSLLLVGHVLLLVWLGREDDLLIRRRRFRLWFVGLVTVQVCAVLIVEAAYLGEAVPAFLEALNAAAIILLVTVLSVPLLTVDTGVLWQSAAVGKADVQPDTPEDSDSAPETQRESALARALGELMASGYYQTSGLSISQLADALGTKEHLLRVAINQELGYRNFSAFLNHYRIETAKQRLSDKAFEKTPVLTIALDLGYQSIGPFNRAFKSITGTTPTLYRRGQLKKLANSENM